MNQLKAIKWADESSPTRSTCGRPPHRSDRRACVANKIIRMVRLLTVTAMVASLISSTAVAQKGGKKRATSYKVCVVFDDLPDDRVFSDDLGSYCQQPGKIIAGVGAGFRLDTTKSTRTVGFNFGDTGPGLFDGSNLGYARVDMRIGKEYLSDEFGNLILDDDGLRQTVSDRLYVGNMEVGEVARAALTIGGYYDNASGDEQRFAISYAHMPGYEEGELWHSAPVKVTRWPGNVWTIETVSPQDEWNGSIVTLHGPIARGTTYFMPFGITMVEKD